MVKTQPKGVNWLKNDLKIIQRKFCLKLLMIREN